MKRLFVLGALVLAFSLLAVGSATAQDDDADVDVDVDAPSGITVSDEECTVEIREPISEDAEADVGGVDLDEQAPIELWEALSGLLIPLIVGIIVRQGWTSQYKNAALFGVSVLVSAVGLYFQGDLDRVEDWVTTIMTIVLLAFGSYKTLWQAAPLPQWIEEHTGGDPMASASYNVVKAPPA
jgi:hypothetical protein